MKQKEQLEKMKQNLNAISKAINELEKGDNVAFYKSLLQKQCIDLYEQADLLQTEAKASPTPHITIIKQEEVLEPVKIQEPVITPEPVREKVSFKPEIKTAPVVEKKAIIPPPVEIQVPEPVIEEIQSVVEPVIESVQIPEIEIPVTPAVPVIPKTEKPAEKKPLVQDTKPTEDLSLNEKLSLNKQPVINIAEKSKETPIADLAKAISISKKFEFIKGLFAGDGESYKAAIGSLQNAASYADAVMYIDTQVRSRYDWSENEALADEMLSLLKRRFMN
jgi:hypothetical protein